VIDVLMTVSGKHPDVSRTMLLQAFCSRFAVGILAATVTMQVHPVLTGAIVGRVVSLPDACGLNSYFGVPGTGLLLGELTAWAVKMWVA